MIFNKHLLCGVFFMCTHTGGGGGVGGGGARFIVSSKGLLKSLHRI